MQVVCCPPLSLLCQFRLIKTIYFIVGRTYLNSRDDKNLFSPYNTDASFDQLRVMRVEKLNDLLVGLIP